MSEPAQTYAGLMAQLAQQADLLTKQGVALQHMGPVAPPCLARPYRQYKELVKKTAAQLYEAFGLQEGPEKLAELIEKTRPFQGMIDGLPELIGSWSDAPTQWQPEAYGGGDGGEEGEIPPVPNPPLGRGLRQSVELTNYLRDGLRRNAPIGPLPAEMAAVEEVAGTTFLRGAWNLGKGALRFVERKALPLWLAWEIGSRAATYLWQKFDSPPSNVSSQGLAGGIFNNVKLFEEDYLPRVAQQWQAMVRIYRMSGGNPDVVREMMKAWDPQQYEVPLMPRTEDYDLFLVAQLMSIETRSMKSRYSWLGLPTLVAGCLGSIVAVRD